MTWPSPLGALPAGVIAALRSIDGERADVRARLFLVLWCAGYDDRSALLLAASGNADWIEAALPLVAAVADGELWKMLAATQVTRIGRHVTA